MKRVLRFVAILLLLISLLVLVPSGNIVAMAEIIEIPLEDKVGLVPQPDGYLSDWEYQDPSISVKIEKGRIYETNYLVAHVKLANASQIRSTMAGNYYNEYTIGGVTMGKRTNSVLAINGDFFTERNGVGLVVRQGKQYRNKCNGYYDILIIDEKGDLHILPHATKEDVEAFEGTPINTYTFGPALVLDGVKQTGFVDMNNAALKEAQRMCLAQVGPLEYLCIASEGPEDKGSVGLTMEQFSELVASFEGVQNAYNLDGGSSTTMVFKRDKINSPNNSKRRHISDMIYFASAYQPDE